MEIVNVVNSLAALAQENRIRVFRHLVQAGPQGLAAGQLAEELGLAAATLSFHLKELKHAGLINCTRKGRSLIYAPNFEHMQTLINFLLENCCCGECSS
ncbi:MAG: metalloregulator ArsR/SmtB family transcription factor [Gammaproteobacteria bacterium]|nr:metalloregulator ArsR/SmtB family transcription factor [Gammaproteobacteria bacterium]MDH5727700.1 metalloregulator ArsR/SmtB family transcription factor [Gammaproteobacteria bacterium]